MRERNQVSEADMGWAQARAFWIVRILRRRYEAVRGVGGGGNDDSGGSGGSGSSGGGGGGGR